MFLPFFFIVFLAGSLVISLVVFLSSESIDFDTGREGKAFFHLEKGVLSIDEDPPLLLVSAN